jgi:hypothetical protein
MTSKRVMVLFSSLKTLFFEKHQKIGFLGLLFTATILLLCSMNIVALLGMREALIELQTNLAEVERQLASLQAEKRHLASELAARSAERDHLKLYF